MIRDYPSRAAWLARRHESIGASDAQAIWGVGYEGHNPRTVYEGKVNPAGRLELESEEQKWRMRLGLKAEPMVRELFEEETGLELVRIPMYRVYYAEDRPHVSSTPDDVVRENGLEVPLDLKYLSAWADEEWEDKGLPLKYQIQSLHQQYTMGAPYGYVCGLIGGFDFQWRKVERDDAFLAKHLRRMDRFWKCVQEKTPPKMMAGPELLQAMKALHPEDDGMAIELAAVAATWLDDFIDASEEMKSAEKARKTAESALREAIQGHTYARIGDRAVSLKTTEKAAVSQRVRTILEEARRFLATVPVMGAANRAKQKMLLTAIGELLSAKITYRTLRTIKTIPAGTQFVAGPEDNPVDDVPPTQEEWEAFEETQKEAT